jgi:CubicO group peptidase (beta-lactamase class C family)
MKIPAHRCLARPGGVLLVIAFFFTSQPAFPAPALNSVLDPIRTKYNLPSLAGAIFTTDGIVEMSAVGVRKAGTDIAVTTHDLWHLGSDTKMMTAALAGTFVAEGKLAWDDKIISFFPELGDRLPAQMWNVTLAQVLAHQAGLKENLDWRALAQSGSLTEQRLTAAQIALTSPAYQPGTYHYANTDYVVVGAILEKIGGKPWEDLIRERVFRPLGMTSVGFGGLGTTGQIDQPWPHFESGLPVSENGPLVDNPEVMGPAGTVHCTITDWAKFLIDQLRGATGTRALLPPEIYQAMQTPVPNPHDWYGYGWSVCYKPWAGGNALTHAGSNNLNFAVCWLAPEKKFGVLVCSNQGGDTVRQACDDAASAMIKRYLATVKTPSLATGL